MNTIFSCIIGMVGGASLTTFLVGIFGALFIEPCIYSRRQFRAVDDLMRYSALCGAVLGLILVLGFGQRL